MDFGKLLIIGLGGLVLYQLFGSEPGRVGVNITSTGLRTTGPGTGPEWGATIDASNNPVINTVTGQGPLGTPQNPYPANTSLWEVPTTYQTWGPGEKGSPGNPVLSNVVAPGAAGHTMGYTPYSTEEIRAINVASGSVVNSNPGNRTPFVNTSSGKPQLCQVPTTAEYGLLSEDGYCIPGGVTLEQVKRGYY